MEDCAKQQYHANGINTFRFPATFGRICIRTELEFINQEMLHICVVVFDIRLIQRKGQHMSGGPINLPKFLPISFFRRVSRFIGVSGHLAFQ